MKTLSRTLHGASDQFLPTQWTVIVTAAETETSPKLADAALAQLCETYWPPLYSFLRHRGYTPHDAQDLIQSFFAYLIERRVYARADQTKGKFRSFLLASLKNHLSDTRDREVTLKRGGGTELLPLHEAELEEIESLFQSHYPSSETTGEDRLFELSWAEALVSGALHRLTLEYEGGDKDELFGELKIFLTGGPDPIPTYEELSARLHVSPSTLRSDVTRLRARYRAALRAEVRRTVATDAEVETELRELLRVLVRH